MADVEVMDLAVPPPEAGPGLLMPSEEPSSVSGDEEIKTKKSQQEKAAAVVEARIDDVIISLASDKNGPSKLEQQLQLEHQNPKLNALLEKAVPASEEFKGLVGKKVGEEETNGIAGTSSESEATITPSGSGACHVNVTLGESSKSVVKHMEPPATPTTVLPKKSNLKRPREGGDTPESNASASSTSAKRIRIVENLEEGSSKEPKKKVNGGSGNPEVPLMVTDPSTVTEVISCEEKLLWLNCGSSSIDQTIINVDYVRDNLCPAKRKFSVEIDMRFILSDTITAVLGSKSSIATVGPADFHLWVARNAPYSNKKLKAVYRENFLKLANLDAILSFDLTSPKELTTENDCLSNDLYYVGELWHDSKGFREYILNSQNSSQFSTKIYTWKITSPGVSLNVIRNKIGVMFQSNKSISSSLDKEDFPHLPTEAVESFDGTKPQDLLDIDAIDDFVSFIRDRTNGVLLHTLISDNPEISYAYESCREIRFQKYFYCQCLVALRCIREGGTFVCKIFDTFTLFTNGLLFLLYKCFKSITMHKPSASSAYTSERFLICKGKLDNADSRYAVDFLMDCFDMVVNNQKQMKIVRRRATKRLTVIRMEVQALIPLKQILGHAEFFQYVRRTNIRLSMELAESIDQVCQYMENGDEEQLSALSGTLRETHSSKIALWKVPCKPREHIPSTLMEEREMILKCEKFLFDNHDLKDISFKELQLENICSITDLCTSPLYESFVAFPIQGTENNTVFRSTRGLFYGSGASNILHFDGTCWHHLKYPEFSLPCRTLLLGEITEDICKSGNCCKFVRTFHVFDGIFISGVFIGTNHLEKRQMMLRRFLKSVNNSTYKLNENCCVIPYLPINELSSFYSHTTTDFKNIGYPSGIRCYSRCDSDQTFGLVGGFLLLKSIEDTSPKNFFSSYNRYAWVWRLEGYSGEALEKIPD